MASAEKLNNLLKKIFLNGMIDNCKIVTYEDGVWMVEAIDERTAVLLVCQSKILKGNEWDLGIGDIETLIKWLSLVKDGEIDLERKDNRLTLISDNFGSLKYLLSEMSSITTQPDIDENDQSPLDKILEGIQYEVELPKDVRDALVKVMKIVKPQLITLQLVEGEVSFAGGNETGNQFEIPIGSLKNTDDSFSVTVDGKAMLNVLSVVEGIPEILFTDHAPVVIRENEDFIFAVNTLASEE